jgi:hypothetical protein
LDRTATSLSGWTGHLTLNRNSGTWITNAMLWGVSPGFESGDVVFTYRTGLHGAHGVLLWRKTTPDRFSRYRQFWAAKFWTWDSKRDLQGDGLFGVVSATFLNYWSAGAHGAYFRRVQTAGRRAEAVDGLAQRLLRVGRSRPTAAGVSWPR